MPKAEGFASSTWNILGKNRWSLASAGFVSDDVYATANLEDSVVGYGDFDNLDAKIPADVVINKVEVCLEFYITSNNQFIKVAISTDGGANYSDWSIGLDIREEDLIFLNVTGYKSDWLPSFLSNDNLKVKLLYGFGGGSGCPEKHAWTAYLDAVSVLASYSGFKDKGVAGNFHYRSGNWWYEDFPCVDCVKSRFGEYWMRKKR